MKKEQFTVFMLLLLLIFVSCEGGIDFSGTEKVDKGVNVNMTIVLKNAYSDSVYLLLDNEMQNESTLLASNSSRSINDAINLTSDSRYEHKYDLLIKARWGEGNYVETTHYVDYKKYELNFDDGLDAAPSLNLLITATFNGTNISVNEVQE
ncbi:MAG: hypothetical protein JW735_03095 [Prolixibacteraceae bacterium]|nr:hypothetical protein [Prolixibacteraceae bacterium]